MVLPWRSIFLGVEKLIETFQPLLVTIMWFTSTRYLIQNIPYKIWAWNLFSTIGSSCSGYQAWIIRILFFEETCVPLQVIMTRLALGNLAIWPIPTDNVAYRTDNGMNSPSMFTADERNRNHKFITNTKDFTSNELVLL